MAGEINIYAADADDFDSEGLCALLPTEWTHEEEANGDSTLTMKHPYDPDGRHRLIQRGCILRAEVPVRTVPEIYGGAIIATAERWTVKATATKAQRYQYSKKSGGRKMKLLPAGFEVMVVQKGEERYKIKSSKYGSGWIAIDALELEITDVPYGTDAQIEAATPSEVVRFQLFRIRDVQRGETEITVTAPHISYDLRGNLTSYQTDKAFTAQQMLDGLFSGCLLPHDFSAVTDIGDTRTAIELVRVNPIYGILDGENGFVARFGGELIRDNYELTILRRAGMDRGFTVEYARNMTAIGCKESGDPPVTGILPVGKNKDGSELFLDGQIWIAAPNADSAAVPNIVELQVDDATVGDGVSVALARQRMREAVEAEWEKGVHLPGMELDVEFALLGDAPQYASYRALEKCYLYDTVTVWHADVCGEVKLNVVSRTWDGLARRYKSVKLGALGVDMSTSKITNLQLPSAINGLKIANGSLNAGKLANGAVAFRHVQAESIGTQALQAESVTAEKIAAEAITVDKLDAAEVNALIAKIVVAEIESAKIDVAQITDLEAEIARISQAVIGSADIDFGQIKDLVAGTAIIEEGVGGQLFIKRLAVTEANMVSLTVGELVVKGKDGSFYSVSVGEDGQIETTLKQIANDDVKDLSINAGEKIIEGTVTAACLNATDIFANNAIIQKLIAANIDVAELFANNAFVSELYTSKIYGGKSIEMIAGEAAAAQNAADAANGAVKKTVKTVDVEYYLSNSSTELVGGTWSTTAPAWVNGKYMWSRTTTILQDGTVSHSNVTCIAGAKGATGATGAPGAAGNGVSSIVEEFYLSNSKTTQTGGSWQGTMPTWVKGKYVWTRSKITYTNGSTAYTQPYCDTGWEAANDAQEIAEAATIYNSPEPPAPPIEKGRKWIDTGVNPWALRSWIGADVSNAREFGVGANDVNPAILDSGRVNSWTEMEIRAELVQLGAGTPSKTNLRRIPRIQEVVLSNPGKNLFNLDLFQEISVIRGTIEFIDDGLTIRASGDNCYTGGWNRSDSEHLSRRIYVSSGEKIAISWNRSGADGRVSVFFDGVPESEVASNSGKIEVSVPEGISFITVRFGVTSAGGSATYKNIQIEVSEHPTQYEPFNGNAVRIPMPSGFYGGIVNPVEGMIRSDIQVVNLNGTETWVTANTQGGGKQRMRLLGFSDYVHPNTNSIAVDGACSHYPTVKADDTFLEKTGFSSQDGYAPEGILFFDPDYQSVEAWKAFLVQQNAAGTPVQIAVKKTNAQYFRQKIDLPRPMIGRNRLSSTLGKLGVSAMASGWETVSDTSEIETALGEAQLDIEQAQEAANQATENLERRVRLDANGLHLGDSQTNNELLMQSALIHFVINGQRVSTIASDYHRFGNMEIRTPSSAGGIVIQAVQ